MRPELLVGVLGLVLLAATLGAIAADWEDLSGRQGFTATVSTKAEEHHLPAGELGAGQSRAFTVQNGRANTHHVHVRLEWREAAVAGAQLSVTLTVADPRGNVVGKATGQGGTAGITLERKLLGIPEGSAFSTTTGNEEDLFEERYPRHEEHVGAWTFTAQTAPSTQPGAGTIQYGGTFRVSYYEAALAGTGTGRV